MSDNRKPKIFYGYIIVLVALGIQVVGWGMYASYGVFFNPLLIEFGSTRAIISGAASVSYLILGVTAVIAGRLGDKIGPRIIITGCALFLGLGYIPMSQIRAIWQLYLLHGVIGIGTSGLDVLLLSTIARWFVKRRGLMSGLLKVGTGIGILIMPLVSGWLISIYGWRTSYLILGGVTLVFIILAAQFLSRDPGKKGLVPYGTDEANIRLTALEAGVSLWEAMQLQKFWTLCAICLFTHFCTQTVVIHIVSYGVDLGIPLANAASILAAIGGVSIVGRIVMGSASDRFGARLAISICFPVMAVALFCLQLSRELWMLYLCVIVYGFVHGGFFALLSPLVAELFGLVSHGAIFGAVLFSGAIGASVGPFLVGHTFDVTGNYQLGFRVCSLLVVGSSILALLLRPPGARA